MTLPSSGSINMTQIANEYGFTQGSATRLGDYRTTNGQGNFPVSFGALSFSSIDGGGSIPVGSNPISMSDFRGTQLQQVVNFYGAGKGGNRLNAKNRYNTNGSNDVNVVGNYKSRPSNSSGSKVHINVNQLIGCEKTDPDHCALRTGSWDASTTLQVDVGGSGRIFGGGGDGGEGANGSSSGSQGQPGTSGLGVEYNATVNVASGGVISCGFGGGGGGGGAFDYDHKSWRTASGGGGGGGCGVPLGDGGDGGNGGAGGNDGSGASSTSEAGEGGSGGNNGNEAVGGGGGEGGSPGEAPDAGARGEGGEGSGGSGGPAGANGAAIRRTNNSISVSINNNGTINGVTNATTVQ